MGQSLSVVTAQEEENKLGSVLSFFSPDLCFILLQQPAGTCPSGVIGDVQHHYAFPLPADERAVGDALHHGQEVLIAVVTGGDHREARPIKFLQHLKDDLQLQGCRAGELQVDRAALLGTQRHKKTFVRIS